MSNLLDLLAEGLLTIRSDLKLTVKFGDASNFMTKKEYESQEPPYWHGFTIKYGYTVENGVLVPKIPHQPSNDWTEVLRIEAKLPYTEELMEHYTTFLEYLRHKNDKMVFHRSSVHKGKELRQLGKTHKEFSPTRWYSRIKQMLKDEGKDITEFEHLPLPDLDETICNPLLLTEKTVVDEEDKWRDDLIFLDIRIPKNLSKNEEFLTADKIVWLMKMFN